jgi:hypothetical protein
MGVQLQSHLLVICSSCWSVTKRPHTRNESAWNWTVDHMVPARWCNWPYSETIHGGPSGNISGARYFTARRASMAFLFACDYFLRAYLKAKMYTARPRTTDNFKIAIRKQTSAVPEDMGQCAAQWRAICCMYVCMRGGPQSGPCTATNMGNILMMCFQNEINRHVMIYI